MNKRGKHATGDSRAYAFLAKGSNNFLPLPRHQVVGAPKHVPQGLVRARAPGALGITGYMAQHVGCGEPPVHNLASLTELLGGGPPTNPPEALEFWDLT